MNASSPICLPVIINNKEKDAHLCVLLIICLLLRLNTALLQEILKGDNIGSGDSGVVGEDK